MKATCETVHDAIQPYIEPFPLAEPTEDDMAPLCAFVEKATEPDRRS